MKTRKSIREKNVFRDFRVYSLCWIVLCYKKYFKHIIYGRWILTLPLLHVVWAEKNRKKKMIRSPKPANGQTKMKTETNMKIIWIEDVQLHMRQQQCTVLYESIINIPASCNSFVLFFIYSVSLFYKHIILLHDSIEIHIRFSSFSSTILLLLLYISSCV